MNPYIVIAALIALISTNIGSAYLGKEYGKNAQKAKDQVHFDQVNADLTEQKDAAFAALLKNRDNIIDLQIAQGDFMTKLEVERAKNRDLNTAIKRANADSELRFTATKDSVCGQSGGDAGATEIPETSSQEPRYVVIKIPDALTASLRGIVEDADDLWTEYQACYSYVYGIDQVGAE